MFVFMCFRSVSSPSPCHPTSAVDLVQLRRTDTLTRPLLMYTGADTLPHRVSSPKLPKKKKIFLARLWGIHLRLLPPPQYDDTEPQGCTLFWMPNTVSWNLCLYVTKLVSQLCCADKQYAVIATWRTFRGDMFSSEQSAAYRPGFCILIMKCNSWSPFWPTDPWVKTLLSRVWNYQKEFHCSGKSSQWHQFCLLWKRNAAFTFHVIHQGRAPGVFFPFVALTALKSYI